MSTQPTTFNVARPTAKGYGALLTWGEGQEDNMYVFLAPGLGKPLERATAEPAQASPSTASNPEDFRPEGGRIYSITDFSGGEGLDRAHRKGASALDGTRFWDSQGVDVTPPTPGTPARAKLLHTMAIPAAGTSANTNLFVCRAANSTTILWADGKDVKSCTNILATTPTISTEAPEAGGVETTVAGLGMLGGQAYCALGAEGIHVRTSAASWSHWSNLAATALWTAKGRVIAAVANVLYDAGATTTSTALKTLETGETWTDVVDAGAVILAASSDGNVYAFAEEASSLVLRGQTDFGQEVPQALAFSSGLVLVGTGEPASAGGKIGRLYVAQLSGFRLRNAQLLRQWGSGAETRDRCPRRFLATRDAIFCGVIEDGTNTYLWKYHLATAGVTRDRKLGAVGLVEGLTVLDERIVASCAASGIYRETANYEASGYLISAPADFYSSAKKSWVGVRVDNDALLDDGSSIAVAYATDPSVITTSSTGWTTLETVNYHSGDDTGREADELPLTNVSGRFLTLKATLTASTTPTVTPQVLLLSCRAYERVEDVVIALPVSIMDRIERPFRKPVTVPGQGLAVYDRLKAREGLPCHLYVLRTGERIRGRIELVSAPIHALAKRGSSLSYATCRVRGVKVTA